MDRLLRRLLLTIILTILGWQLLKGARAAVYEYGLFHSRRVVPALPTDAAHLGLREVDFPSKDGDIRLRGWYIASRTGASVIVIGGSNSTRFDMLPYARLLSEGGTGVLLFDWPGCGESDGSIGLGATERDAVRAAVAFVAQQRDVRNGRIGLLGFSVGAHHALFAAAQDTLVRALIVEGVFGNPWTQGRAEYEGRGITSQWGALLGDLLGGMERNTPDANTAAAQIAPRPLLVVAGTLDRSVPVRLSRDVFDHAGQPKEFWLIPGAGHGTYLTADPTYGPRLRRFIENALQR